MDEINSFLEVQNAIKSIKDYGNGFITNFYPEVDKVNSWIDNGHFHKKIIGETVFFLREEAEFSYLFYCSTSKVTLNHSLFQLNNILDGIHLVADIIGKDPEVQSIIQVFKKNNFYLYTTLKRMSRSVSVDETRKPFPGIKEAQMSHADIIFKLLHQYFDPIAEQLPSLKEISNWIRLNHLILIEEKGEILGFVIFDLIGVTSYLRYWFVHPQHRNRKIGSGLLNEYFNKSAGTKRQLFWVIQSNDNAINRYLHYGFQSEKLFDYIMTNKNIHYETTYH
jgi:ribosomal protein S18 acetylase RimI-like enzyme